jgi:hypothetical protein
MGLFNSSAHEGAITWRKIKSKSDSSVFDICRAKVIGGWLVSSPDGLTFVPDPEYLWELEPL